MKHDVLIVGAGIIGTYSAIQIARADGDARIRILDRDPLAYDWKRRLASRTTSLRQRGPVMEKFLVLTVLSLPQARGLVHCASNSVIRCLEAPSAATQPR